MMLYRHFVAPLRWNQMHQSKLVAVRVQRTQYDFLIALKPPCDGRYGLRPKFIAVTKEFHMLSESN